MKEIDYRELESTIQEFEKTVNALRIIRETGEKTSKAASGAAKLSEKTEVCLQDMRVLHDELLDAVKEARASNSATVEIIRKSNEEMKASVKKDCDMVL